MGRVNSHAVAKGDLPSGFKELAYIASTGTQYIDTGFKPNQDTRVLFNGTISPTTNLGLFGAEETNNYYYFGKAASNSDNNIYYSYGTGQPSVRQYGFYGAIHTVDANKNVLQIDESFLTITAAVATFQLNYNFYLFGANSNGTFKFATNSTLFYCKMYDNGTLVRDYVPAYDTVNDRPCLYDKLNNVAYYNQGTGEFLYS